MSDVIDRASALPLWRQIANWMETQVTTGQWQPDERLPGEIELSHELGVSRGSLRKAIGRMITRGMLVQYQGKGTYVTPTVLEQTWASRLVAISEEFSLQGVPFTRELLGQTVRPAAPHTARSLGLAPGTPVLSIKRLYRVKGAPVLMHDALFDAARFSGLIDEDLPTVSLIEVMQRRFGVHLEWATHSISVIRADAWVAENLAIGLGDPVLYDEQETFDQYDSCVLLIRGWYRSDRFRLHTLVHRHQEEPLKQ